MKLVKLTVRVPRHVYDAAYNTARREGNSISAFIRGLMAPAIRPEILKLLEQRDKKKA